ncbi:MAG: DUF4440 domain-containing protein [Chitinophagaceae bacterium]|nr:DUF4440 domain-containing protein [Chitinophagaceae bacterium]
MKKFLPLLLLPLLFSCKYFNFKKDDARIKALNEMQQTDVDFSNLSKQKGFRKAFTEYIDDDGVLLRRDRMPMLGADAIQYINNFNDSSVLLTWEPRGADVSEGGDLGYTYGIYTMKDSASTSKGTYVTIWRKQKDGKWKFVLDTGNQGVGEDATQLRPEE